MRPTSTSPETLAALTAAGALTLTHVPSNTQTVILGEHQATISSVDDLLRFLESHAILQGEPNR